MPDSLFFDGIDDLLTVSQGSISSSGAYTVAVAAKLVANEAAFKTMIGWEAAGSASLGFENSSPHLLSAYGGSGAAVANSTFTCPAADGWCIYAYNRASGGTGKLHKYVFGTDTWTHEANGQTLSADAAGATTFGALDAPAQFLDANLLIAGWWNSELSDGTIETLEGGTPAWVAASPAECWRFDTLSAISSLTGSADETSRTGTTLDVGDAPTGWVDGGTTVAWLVA